MTTNSDIERLETALRRSLQRQGAIARFGTRALVAIDLGTLLQQAVEEVALSVDAEYVKIMEYRSWFKGPAGPGRVGWKEGIVGHATLPVHMRSPPGRSYLTSEPTRITDIRQSEEFDYSDLLKDHGVISLVNVPIAWDGHTYGVLEIDSRSFTDFLDDTIQFLHGFANFLAAAIQRKRQEEEREILFRELQHRIKNSLQMILSLLRLEQRKGDPNGFDRVNDAVQAISLAYDQLQGSREIKQVSLDRYLVGCAAGSCRVDWVVAGSGGERHRAGVARLRQGGGPRSDRQRVGDQLGQACLPEDASGIIRVAFHVEEGEGFLVVEDDGRGTSTGDQAEPGMGSQLLTAMARQIVVLWNRTWNTGRARRHTLRFPLDGQ